MGDRDGRARSGGERDGRARAERGASRRIGRGGPGRGRRGTEAEAEAEDADAADATATRTDAEPNEADAEPEETDADAEPEETDDAEPESEDEAEADAESDDAETIDAEAPRPPRIDGTYLGATMFTGLGLVRVNDYTTDGPFAAFGGTASVGQMVFPWLGLGLHGGGGGGVRSQDGARQRLGEGYLGVEFKFVPAPAKLPLSLRASFGFGGGAVRQAGIEGRSGFGGAQFGGAVRYELFPWAKRKRPYRGGGFGLGPELGWIGFTPAAAGRPMSNVIYLALATTFYFGS